MIRVTIELVPYGAEAMAKTIAELCIANTGTGTAENADYQAAGYIVHTDNKIEDYATELKIFHRNSGVLNLVKEILSQEQKPVDAVELAEALIRKTRLFAAGEIDEE